MRILVIGLGVIGTAYGYIFQNAGHRVEHLIRNSKKGTTPNNLKIELLDGRFNNKGEEKKDSYMINIANPGNFYDFILISVSAGKLESAIKALRGNCFKGTLLIFNGIWEDRRWLDTVLKG
ncbi:ketopantoate reductase family protein [Clostridium sp. LBM24168]